MSRIPRSAASETVFCFCHILLVSGIGSAEICKNTEKLTVIAEVICRGVPFTQFMVQLPFILFFYIYIQIKNFFIFMQFSGKKIVK